VNVADPQLGPSFRVVSSTSVPAHSEDPWVGVAVPWRKYPTAHDPMARGEPFQHVGVDEPGRGWSRSLLSVPIFVGDNWMGNVGFVDITRRTSWSDEAIRMLQVAAPMLGNYWERDVTRRRLEELVRSKDRFVASVSHELRTPLAAVLGFAEELRDSADSFQPQELTGMLELIADQSQEMANMVEDLLVSARADIGTISIVGQEVYLRSQAEATLAGLGSIGARTIDVVGGPGKVWADPSRTRQIIRNLLTNAVRYGGTEVTVEATELGERTMLSIRDNGPGLPEAEWERIFEPYERAHDTPTHPASIGLGLTVSRQLARLMDGDLTYESDGSSSVFKLVLPAAERDDRAGQAVPSLADSTRAV
jgi:signal transduction histidine kinase